MIEKSIYLEGKEFVLMNKIHDGNKNYLEYRSDELGMIKFFEYENEKIKEVSDKEHLKKVIERNYVVED